MQQAVDENLYIIEKKKGSEEEGDEVGELVGLGAKLHSLGDVGAKGEELVGQGTKLQSLEDVGDGDKKLVELGENMQSPENIGDRDEDLRNMTRTLRVPIMTKRSSKNKRGSVKESSEPLPVLGPGLAGSALGPGEHLAPPLVLELGPAGGALGHGEYLVPPPQQSPGFSVLYMWSRSRCWNLDIAALVYSASRMPRIYRNLLWNMALYTADSFRCWGLDTTDLVFTASRMLKTARILLWSLAVPPNVPVSWPWDSASLVLILYIGSIWCPLFSSPLVATDSGMLRASGDLLCSFRYRVMATFLPWDSTWGMMSCLASW